MRAELLSSAFSLLVVLVAVVLLIFALLLVLRASRSHTDARRIGRRRAVRSVLLAALMGEPADAAEAREALTRRLGRSWGAAEEQAFSMLPKIKGESRAELVGVLLAKDASARAVAKTSAWSLVRRCQGAHELGALSQVAAVPVLLPMLDDRSFLVRRTAVRALGSIGDAAAVGSLLQVTGEEPRLTNDLVVALDRIGRPAGPALRAELERGLTRSSGAGRQADLAAVGLGLIGDVEAVELLTDALTHGGPGLRAAAAVALGQIGTPEAVDPLIRALDSPLRLVRHASIEALGDLGSSRGARALGALLDREDHELSRRAASALVRLESAGLQVLRDHDSAYAVEALALASLREAG